MAVFLSSDIAERDELIYNLAYPTTQQPRLIVGGVVRDRDVYKAVPGLCTRLGRYQPASPRATNSRIGVIL